MPEQVFLNEANVYVSSTRVVIERITFAMAHVTSVRTHYTPPNVSFSLLLILVGGAATLFGFIATGRSGQDGPAFTLVAGLILLIVGIVLYRAQQPTYEVAIVNSAREHQTFTTADGVFVQRIQAAIADALNYRG